MSNQTGEATFANRRLWQTGTPPTSKADIFKALTLLHQDMQIFTIANNPESGGTLGIAGSTTVTGNLTVTGTFSGGTTLATHLANTALSPSGIRVDNAPAPAIGAALTFIGGTQATWVVPAAPSLPNPAVGYARSSGNDLNPGTASSPCLTVQGLYNLGYRSFDLGIGSFGNVITSGAGNSLSFHGIGEDQTVVGNFFVPAGSLTIHCDRTVQFGNVVATGQTIVMQGCWANYVDSAGTAPAPADIGFPGNAGENGGNVTLRDCRINTSVIANGGAGQDGSQGVNLSENGFDGGVGGNGGTIEISRSDIGGDISAQGGAGGTGGAGNVGDDGAMTPGGNGGNGGQGGSAGPITLDWTQGSSVVAAGNSGGSGGVEGTGTFGNGTPGTAGFSGNGSTITVFSGKFVGSVDTGGENGGDITMYHTRVAGQVSCTGIGAMGGISGVCIAQNCESDQPLPPSYSSLSPGGSVFAGTLYNNAAVGL